MADEIETLRRAATLIRERDVKPWWKLARSKATTADVLDHEADLGEASLDLVNPGALAFARAYLEQKPAGA